MKLIILILFLAASMSAATVADVRHLSEFGTTNVILPGDLISVSTAPGTVNEKLWGLSPSNLINSYGVIYVDSVNGNDNTAIRSKLLAPFSTASNALAAAQNGDTIIFRPGTYTNNTFAGPQYGVNGVMNLFNKTNITIYGNGAILYSSTTNEHDYLSISNASSLTIRDLTFYGTPVTNATGKASGAINNSVIAMRGTNKNVRFINCSLLNWPRQGIWADDAVSGGISSNITIQGCYFYNIGSTNSAIGADGAAVLVTAPQWSVTDCIFENCLRGLELEGLNSAGASSVKGARIAGNKFVNLWQYGIILFPDNSPTNYCDVAIADNYFGGFVTYGSLSAGLTAINVQGGNRVLILNNTIRNINGIAMQLLPNSADLENLVIANNTICDIGTSGGYGIDVDGFNVTHLIRDITITANIIDNTYSAGINVNGVNVKIINNVLRACGTFGVGVASIQVHGNDGVTYVVPSTNIIVQGNSFSDTNSTARIAQGITVDASAQQVQLIDNVYAGGFLTRAYTHSGANGTVREFTNSVYKFISPVSATAYYGPSSSSSNGLFFSTNSTAANGSLYLDLSGILWLRTNSAWIIK